MVLLYLALQFKISIKTYLTSHSENNTKMFTPVGAYNFPVDAY